ncbi:MAG: DUF4230 domain-containing protein [Chloroflexi bacterium]|nr:DUF4230 domain-containing protein [Chloroflexota bacterium]
MKSTVFWVIVFSLVALVIGIAIVNPLIGLIPSLGSVLGVSPSVQGSTTRTIVNGIQPLGKLVTLSVEVAHANVNVRASTSLCGYEANHVSQSVIEAGIDISDIDEDSIRYDDDKDVFTVESPAPAITSCRNEYFDQYAKSGGGTATCFDDFWDDMSIIGRHLSMERFVQDALESGILKRAENQATIVMGNFISAVTGSKVHIEYDVAPGEPRIPSSCRLDLPPGWEKDAEGGWKRAG